MGPGDGKQYRMKWADLREELDCYNRAGHNLFRDPVEVWPQKQQKIILPQAIAPSANKYRVAGLNENDGGEHGLSDPEVSEPDEEDPHIPWIFPLVMGGNQCRHDSALDALDPRMSGQICV